ncbi:hypothetical protein WS54_03065 [Burkholderia sp. NRF60-BP8]|nr:hypothetical protein WS54_03065 [Burkholderia sp. NRF60-BP8]KVA07877.1 hypothetical protein WS54_27540 [Burkholderia sp. NRF60-BP8]
MPGFLTSPQLAGSNLGQRKLNHLPRLVEDHVAVLIGDRLHLIRSFRSEKSFTAKGRLLQHQSSVHDLVLHP